MQISKLDAARRQLESAIRLFFVSGDPVAIHSLAAAARNLLRDLMRAENREAGLDAIFKQQVRPEKLGEVRALIAEAPNFFKHADRDPERVLEFYPRTTEFLLWDACVLYETLTDHKDPLLAVFLVWFALSNPHILLPEVQQKVAVLGQQFDPRNRRGFLGEMLPVAEQESSGK